MDTMFGDLYNYYTEHRQNLLLSLVWHFSVLTSFHYDIHCYVTTNLTLNESSEKIVNPHDISAADHRYLFVLGKDFKKLSLGKDEEKSRTM